jgi:hypothetical protein
MRWGIGKMVAKSKTLPIIIPFYHDGMEKALPLNELTGEMLRLTPKMGVNINVIFGKPIEVKDLIDSFVNKYGRNELDLPWETKESEHVLKLYSSITYRIQQEMQKLDQREAWNVIYPKDDEEEQYLK